MLALFDCPMAPWLMKPLGGDFNHRAIEQWNNEANCHWKAGLGRKFTQDLGRINYAECVWWVFLSGQS
jgi:hypothetical protein